ncbi:MAG: GH92 family glycosyl hydrolase [Ktedonobacteraceae bacterium]
MRISLPGSRGGHAPIVSRRQAFIALGIVFLAVIVLAAPFAIGIFSRPAPGLGFPPESNLDLAQYVNPFIGTVAAPENAHLSSGFNSGNIFPGASYPHGMVQWSPDTTTAPGGYRYNQNTIHGFSLTHFSGRGCSAYQDVPFMPTLGYSHTSPAGTASASTTFSHSNESASPGYYSVRLDQSNIQVALTTTPRTGFGMFTYPPNKRATMLINTGGSAMHNADNGTGVQIIGTNQVVGSAASGNFCGGGNTYTVYFAAMFSQPFTAFGTWHNSKVSAQLRQSSGSHSGAYVRFDTTSQQVVQVKVGISFVSIQNAEMNLAHENPGWNFNAVRQQARAAWNARLNTIQVYNGSLKNKQIFYTALYHTLFHPNIFSDVNGDYIGFDQQIHKASGYVQYENFPGWDMHRSLIGLQAFLYPQETGDMLQSLVMDAEQGGGGLPRWEVANDNSGGMLGDSIDIVIATAYALGVRNFDTQAALMAMDHGASHPGTLSGRHIVREGLQQYLTLGYVPTGIPASASMTLEYASDDFAIAQFAKALGQNGLYNVYLKRSQNWRNLYNPATGYIEPRNADGTFIKVFDPTSGAGFAEGDSAQYTWMVPQDLPGLFKAMGGPVTAIERMDYHFNKLNDGPTSAYAFMGNEPEFRAPWLYDFAGAPYRTQDLVRRIETQVFNNTPGGLGGNDDGGAMSSWYIFAALGIFPEIPGVGGFALDSPLFPLTRVHLNGGHELLITGGPHASDSTPYVQSLSLNNQAYTNSWLPFHLVQNGATLQFTLGSHPNMSWGSSINVTYP